MHFWIDKRSQCAYTGRHRVPSSLSAGRARGRVCASGGGGGGRKGMAAPVHRFAAVDCPPRRPHRSHRHAGPPPMPAVHATRRQNDEPSLYVEIPAEPPQPTIASLAAARSVTPDTLLRTAALGLHHSPMMAPHLKFGMLVSFALATVFLAGAKYYFDRQVSVSPPLYKLEILNKQTPFAFQPPPSEPSDDISLATLLQSSERSQPVTESPEAPPPYKIAVLMPGRDASPPPPAYSSLS
ncbi:hypothetical protein HF086_002705 [Spodoptera exigua]|uniref:Uncharacterized protein n=1 Tax=Spodoptera exigua TaxID=7107 RepID=A0A922SDH3_SPOEX|nr:hypothetical protein HF086_002705 [Spodoptera exigua]